MYFNKIEVGSSSSFGTPHNFPNTTILNISLADTLWHSVNCGVPKIAKAVFATVRYKCATANVRAYLSNMNGGNSIVLTNNPVVAQWGRGYGIVPLDPDGNIWYSGNNATETNFIIDIYQWFGPG